MTPGIAEKSNGRLPVVVVRSLVGLLIAIVMAFGGFLVTRTGATEAKIDVVKEDFATHKEAQTGQLSRIEVQLEDLPAMKKSISEQSIQMNRMEVKQEMAIRSLETISTKLDRIR